MALIPGPAFLIENMNTLIKIILLLLIPFLIKGQTDEWSEWENHVNTCKIKHIHVSGDFLWLATSGGLVRYNKASGESYSFDKGNSNIPDNYINGITNDAEGNIWFTTHFYGIGMYDGDSFNNINTYNSCIPSYQWNLDIKTDSEDNKWFGSLMFVVKFSGDTCQIWETGDPLSSSNFIEDIFVANNDDVWVAGEWGIAVISDSVLSYFNQVTSYIYCIVADTNNVLWFSGKNNRLVKYEGNTFTDIALTSTSSDSHLKSMTVDEYNTLWIASSDGLLKYEEGIETLYSFTNSNYPGGSSIVADDDIIWIGTLSKGLYKYENNTFSEVLYEASEIQDMGRLNDIENFDNSMYFIGMRNKILYLRDNEWDIIDASDGLVDIFNYSLKGSGDKLVLGSCCESPLSYIENNIVTSDNNFIDFDNAIYAVLPVSNNSYWLGTSNGLLKYENSTITEYNTVNSPLVSNKINDIVFDNEGNLWGAMDGGIFKYSNGNWTVYDRFTTELLNFDITKIKVDSNNYIWINALNGFLIGTYNGNGITKFDGITWVNYNINNSALPSNTVFDIYIDEEDNIWCGTFVGGLAKFNQETWTIYSAYNSGIAHNDVTALEKTPDGKLWIGHWRGEVSVLNTNFNLSYDFDQGNEDNIMIYPNPTQGNFSIKFEKALLTPANINIFNLSGEKVGSRYIDFHNTESVYNVSLSDFGIYKSGIYFLQISTKNNVYNKRLMFVK
ncbi:two-component regulator propeller domain-containing protein [Bacteroidota bacterium]